MPRPARCWACGSASTTAAIGPWSRLTAVRSASVDNERVVLRVLTEGKDAAVGADHVIAATGFRTDMRQHTFLSKDIADTIGLPRPTAHRILASLIAEGMVERNDAAKSYRLGLDLFVLAARAGNPMNLRELCRPVLLRLAGSLGETIFLLVRSGFDAVCIDRTAGLLPIRSFTGDIGGSVMLGIGQGSMAILAHLTQAEQDEVIRYNLPRMREFSGFDEAFLRAEIARVRGL